MIDLRNFGPIVMTSGISEWIKDNPESEGVRSSFIQQSLARHVKGDWGDLGDEDKQANDEVFQSPGCDGRLVSRYNFPESLKNTGMDNGIYIISSGYGFLSENVDDCYTTILFPSEY